MDLNPAIIATVSEWWNTWHRFAEEDEDPPENIQALIAHIEASVGKTFDVMRGTWILKT